MISILRRAPAEFPLGSKPVPRELIEQALSRLELGSEGGGHATDRWEACLEAAGIADVRTEPEQGSTNLWLLSGLEDVTQVVDLGSPFGAIAMQFSSLLADSDGLGGRRVTYVSASELHRRIVAKRQPGSAGVEVVSATGVQEVTGVDLVYLLASPGWNTRLGSSTASLRRWAMLAKNMLRPGGWLVCQYPAFPATLKWIRQGVPLADVLGAVLLTSLSRRTLLEMGFSEVRAYGMAPTVGDPSLLVPTSWQGAQAIEALSNMRGQRRSAILRYLGVRGLPARAVFAKV